MGESFPFFDVLRLSGLSMVIVFSCLFVISLLLDGLKILFADEDRQKPDKEKEEQVLQRCSDVSLNEEEFLVLAFTAAIAASSGKSPAQIYIHSMKKINQEDVT